MRRLLGCLFLLFASSIIGRPQPIQYSFSPGLEEFNVEAPCAFRELDHDQDWRVYRCKHGSRYFLITSVLDQETSQLAAVKDQAASEIRVSQSRIGNRFTGALVTRYAFQDVDGNFQNLLTLLSSRRFYLFHSVSDAESDEFVETFFRSITLHSRVPDKRVKLITSPRTIPSLLAGPTRNEGHITRENVGDRKKPTDRREFAVAPNQSSPLKVLHRAQAGYSGLAVLYQIQGTVRLRVTFLDKAEVGALEAIEKLPFGLTANAMAAARLLEFEPEISNGIPRTTTRIVVYSFNIY